MVVFPAWIPDCDSHSPALLDFFLPSDASICSTMAFPPLGNSDHVVVSVSIDFPINSKQDAPFHCIAYDYSHADWREMILKWGTGTPLQSMPCISLKKNIILQINQ